jgi:GTPase Era involved in 16S rRNA processing
MECKQLTDMVQISLRRAPTSTSTVTINADKNRPESERTKLKSFTKTITDFRQLPDVIDEATQAMGLGVVGGINSRAFSRDVLSVEITGPARPQLTLVDLPGLIHTTNKAQNEADKELILNLVKQYMTNKRTIILAVVSAKNDYANQIILDHCRKIDHQGRRTLGIITKPDFLRTGSDNEMSWIDLALNKDIYFELGWHMLKNREENQMEFTFAQRNEDEQLFFNKGRYADLPREFVGIETLRERLSKLLKNHLIKELPALKEEMDTKLQGTIDDMEKLGEKRDTTHEQRMVLMKISMRINDILKSATKGYYEAEFFGNMNIEAPVDHAENIRRFRAVVQHVNIAFANDMRLRGHKYGFDAGPGDNERDTEEDKKAKEDLDKLKGDDDAMSMFLPKPKQLTREEAVQWVKKTLERSRGYELPGTFQPVLISQLFWEQSQPWEQLAVEHIDKVARACKDFVYVVIEESAPPDFKSRLISLSVDAALATSLKAAKEELRKVLKDKSRHPSTYNHYFTTTIQKMRQRKYQKITKDAAKKSEESVYRTDNTSQLCVNPARLEEHMNAAIEQDMDVFSSQEALDTQRAYYKVTTHPSFHLPFSYH